LPGTTLGLQLVESDCIELASDELEPFFIHLSDDLSHGGIFECPGPHPDIVTRRSPFTNHPGQDEQRLRWIEVESPDILPDPQRPVFFPVPEKFLEKIVAVGEVVVEAPASHIELSGEVVYGHGADPTGHERLPGLAQPIVPIESTPGSPVRCRCGWRHEPNIHLCTLRREQRRVEVMSGPSVSEERASVLRHVGSHNAGDHYCKHDLDDKQSQHFYAS